MTTAKQRWRCPICNYVYRSPIRITESLCPKTHTAAEVARYNGKTVKSGRSGRVTMELIEGSLPNETKRKKDAHGSKELRRV